MYAIQSDRCICHCIEQHVILDVAVVGSVFPSSETKHATDEVAVNDFQGIFTSCNTSLRARLVEARPDVA